MNENKTNHEFHSRHAWWFKWVWSWIDGNLKHDLVKWVEQNVIFRDSLVKAMGKLKFEEVIQL